MVRKITVIFVVAILILIAGCLSDSESGTKTNGEQSKMTLEEIAAQLTYDDILKENNSAEEIKTDLLLPTVLEDAEIEWSSSSSEILNNGEVYRPFYESGADSQVTLTAVISRSSDETPVEKDFELTVIKLENADEDIAEKEVRALQDSNIVGLNDTLTKVYYDLELMNEGIEGAEISWSSSDTSIVSAEGEITRPQNNSEEVTLTANIKSGDAVRTVDFKATVVRISQDADEAITNANFALTENLVKGENPSLDEVSSQLNFDSQGIDNTNIQWSTESEFIDAEGNVAVVSEPTEVTITATITAEGYAVNSQKRAAGDEVKMFEVTLVPLNAGGVPSMPVADINNGWITLTTDESDATIYYTLDDSDPEIYGTAYTGPIKLTKETYLQAIAILGTEKSPVYGNTFTWEDIGVDPPIVIIDPPSSTDEIGIYQADVTSTTTIVLTMTDAINDNTITATQFELSGMLENEPYVNTVTIDATNPKLVTLNLLEIDGENPLDSDDIITITYLKDAGGNVFEATTGKDVSNFIIPVANRLPGLTQTNTIILHDDVDPTVVISLNNDIFTDGAEELTNWVYSIANTDLTLDRIEKDSDTQVTAYFTGTADSDIITMQALSTALDGDIPSIEEAIPVYVNSSEKLVTAAGLGTLDTIPGDNDSRTITTSTYFSVKAPVTFTGTNIVLDLNGNRLNTGGAANVFTLNGTTSNEIKDGTLSNDVVLAGGEADISDVIFQNDLTNNVNARTYTDCQFRGDITNNDTTGTGTSIFGGDIRGDVTNTAGDATYEGDIDGGVTNTAGACTFEGAIDGSVVNNSADLSTYEGTIGGNVTNTTQADFQAKIDGNVTNSGANSTFDEVGGGVTNTAVATYSGNIGTVTPGAFSNTAASSVFSGNIACTGSFSNTAAATFAGNIVDTGTFDNTGDSTFSGNISGVTTLTNNSTTNFMGTIAADAINDTGVSTYFNMITLDADGVTPATGTLTNVSGIANFENTINGNVVNTADNANYKLDINGNVDIVNGTPEFSNGTITGLVTFDDTDVAYTGTGNFTNSTLAGGANIADRDLTAVGVLTLSGGTFTSITGADAASTGTFGTAAGENISITGPITLSGILSPTTLTISNDFTVAGGTFDVNATLGLYTISLNGTMTINDGSTFTLDQPTSKIIGTSNNPLTDKILCEAAGSGILTASGDGITLENLTIAPATFNMTNNINLGGEFGTWIGADATLGQTGVAGKTLSMTGNVYVNDGNTLTVEHDDSVIIGVDRGANVAAPANRVLGGIIIANGNPGTTGILDIDADISLEKLTLATPAWNHAGATTFDVNNVYFGASYSIAGSALTLDLEGNITILDGFTLGIGHGTSKINGQGYTISKEAAGTGIIAITLANTTATGTIDNAIIGADLNISADGILRDVITNTVTVSGASTITVPASGNGSVTGGAGARTWWLNGNVTVSAATEIAGAGVIEGNAGTETFKSDGTAVTLSGINTIKTVIFDGVVTNTGAKTFESCKFYANTADRTVTITAAATMKGTTTFGGDSNNTVTGAGLLSLEGTVNGNTTALKATTISGAGGVETSNALALNDTKLACATELNHATTFTGVTIDQAAGVVDVNQVTLTLGSDLTLSNTGVLDLDDVDTAGSELSQLTSTVGDKFAVTGAGTFSTTEGVGLISNVILDASTMTIDDPTANGDRVVTFSNVTIGQNDTNARTLTIQDATLSLTGNLELVDDGTNKAAIVMNDTTSTDAKIEGGNNEITTTSSVADLTITTAAYVENVVLDVKTAINGAVDFDNVTIDEDRTATLAGVQLDVVTGMTINSGGILDLANGASDLAGNGWIITGDGKIQVTAATSADNITNAILNVSLDVDDDTALNEVTLKKGADIAAGKTITVDGGVGALTLAGGTVNGNTTGTIDPDVTPAAELLDLNWDGTSDAVKLQDIIINTDVTITNAFTAQDIKLSVATPATAVDLNGQIMTLTGDVTLDAAVDFVTNAGTIIGGGNTITTIEVAAVSEELFTVNGSGSTISEVTISTDSVVLAAAGAGNLFASNLTLAPSDTTTVNIADNTITVGTAVDDTGSLIVANGITLTMDNAASKIVGANTTTPNAVTVTTGGTGAMTISAASTTGGLENVEISTASFTFDNANISTDVASDLRVKDVIFNTSTPTTAIEDNLITLDAGDLEIASAKTLSVKDGGVIGSGSDVIKGAGTYNILSTGGASTLTELELAVNTLLVGADFSVNGVTLSTDANIGIRQLTLAGDLEVADTYTLTVSTGTILENAGASAIISGAGELSITGAADLQDTANNIDLQIENITVGSSFDVQSILLNTDLDLGAYTMTINTGDTFTIEDGKITGTAAIVTGEGTLSINEPSPVATELNLENVTISTTLALSVLSDFTAKDITLNTNATLNTVMSLVGTLTNNATVTVDGGEIDGVDGAGGTANADVTGGVLVVTNDGTFKNTTLVPTTLTINAGGDTYMENVVLNTGTDLLNTTVDITAGTLELGGITLQGTGTSAITGSGTLVISDDATVIENTVIDSEMTVSSDLTLNTVTIESDVDLGANTLTMAGDVTVDPGTMTIGAGTIDLGGFDLLGGGTLAITGAATIMNGDIVPAINSTSAFTIDAGGVSLIGNDATIGGTITLNDDLTLNSAGMTFDGGNNTVSGTGKFILDDEATVTDLRINTDVDVNENSEFESVTLYNLKTTTIADGMELVVAGTSDIQAGHTINFATYASSLTPIGISDKNMISRMGYNNEVDDNQLRLEIFFGPVDNDDLFTFNSTAINFGSVVNGDVEVEDNVTGTHVDGAEVLGTPTADILNVTTTNDRLSDTGGFGLLKVNVDIGGGEAWQVTYNQINYTTNVQ